MCLLKSIAFFDKTMHQVQDEIRIGLLSVSWRV